MLHTLVIESSDPGRRDNLLPHVRRQSRDTTLCVSMHACFTATLVLTILFLDMRSRFTPKFFLLRAAGFMQIPQASPEAAM